MKKPNASRSPRPPVPPAGRRSGKGASSVVPYLEEARSSKPAPLAPQDEQPPASRKRSLWRWGGER
jgi:hypothetical protein